MTKMRRVAERAGSRTGAAPLLLLVALCLLSAPAAALDGIEIAGEAGARGPTPAENLEVVRAEQKALVERANELAAQATELERRAAELAAKEKELEQEVEQARQEELVTCPPLVRIKYPWLTCSTSASGSKSIDPSGRDSLGPVSRLLLLDAGPPAEDARWGLDLQLLY